MSRPVPCCSGATRFLRAHKRELAGLTGQDARALAAIAHCWDLYAGADADGQRGALAAVRALLPGMQRKYWPLAKELVAFALDWSEVERLWVHVEPLDEAALGRLARET